MKNLKSESFKKKNRLETAAKDARTIAGLLQDKLGFQTRVLINADRFEIYTALDEFRKNLTERDNFLIYYAGHGELDRKTSEEIGFRWMEIIGGCFGRFRVKFD